MANSDTGYPVKLNVDYPDKPLNRLTTFFRIFTVIPIFIILLTLVNVTFQLESDQQNSDRIREAIYTGYVFIPLIFMLLFRRKYPRWWFDWNLELGRFATRVTTYFFLLRDEYPSTDNEQAVHLDIDYPGATALNRWMPLVKWFLAIPHYIVLVFLAIAAVFVIIVAWFAILFTGQYPKSIFDFVVGFMRWSWRVSGYAFLLVTDKYPPFSLAE